MMKIKVPSFFKLRIPGISKIKMPDMSQWRLPGFSVLFGIVTLTTILVVHRIVQNDSLPEKPIQLVLDRDIAMFSEKGIDTTMVKLHKGDTVSYLGVTNGGMRVPVSFVVQTRDGLRGFLSTYDLGYTMLLKNDPDTVPVTVLGMNKEKNETYTKFKIRCGDGKERRVNLDRIRPILPDSLLQQQVRRKSYYFMTTQKFEQLYIGKTLGANDSLYRPAMNIIKTKAGWEAYFQHLYLVNTETGEMFVPLVIYDSDKVAVSYRPMVGKNRNNYLIIKYLPLLGSLVDNGFLAWLIEGPVYQNAFYGLDNYTPNQQSEWKKISVWQWLQLAVYIIGVLIWIFLFGTLPMLLMECCLYCRYIFYPFSDTALTYLFGLVAFVSTYIWFALSTVWGTVWLFLPIILGAGFISYGYSIRHLDTVPHTRCPKCRRMFTMEFDRREFIKEYDEWRHEAVPVSSHSNSWQTWTEVVTKYSDGSSKTDRENVRNHTRTTTTYEEYDVLYHVKEFYEYYKCTCCGHTEKVFAPEEQELKRIYKGTSTSTTET